ncbi:hypothetical protein QQY24_14500 [Streptomyces sp. TG1A-8]|uniref:hypothetical protein n=1 Tax=Streptomyces sp. TG1A-8 TaxID=3051385 RepID=UPI00265C68E9|nr:hypothetical protein [Streptomyces sp. TG1A-8]MDO0926563.1 hypothetical protein [Streptomyces sp. TG1A-8]
MSARTEGGDSHERHSHERHEPYAWHEPTGHDQEHMPPHAGNGTVNHGPEDKGPTGKGLDGRRAGGTGPDGGASDGTASRGPGHDDEGRDGGAGGTGLPGGALDGTGPRDAGLGLAPDELVLRRMLHSAVDDVAPRAGTLDHLRRAVPARRARKRQALVGMAAAALFVGTAVPALIHVSHSAGSDPNTAMAGQSSQTQGAGGRGKNVDAGSGSPQDEGGTSTTRGGAGGKGGTRGGSGGDGTGPSSGAGPSATPAAGAPLCTTAQLGSPTQSVGAPDSAGVVYGTFRVTNVSATACTVRGAGSVDVSAQGAAEPALVSGARHVAGDAAAGLPDPSLEADGLVLKPGAAYEEKFAFVPSQTCPTTGGGTTGGTTGGGTPSPDPSPSQDASATGGTDTSGTQGVTPQLVTEDGTADGSVLVTHTAEGGSPAVTAVVTGACAGTVYYTGLLAAS